VHYAPTLLQTQQKAGASMRVRGLPCCKTLIEALCVETNGCDGVVIVLLDSLVAPDSSEK